ncbi:hypothetical protein OF83DRAFT_1178401 [Amylostereum chailletii]|nr:hypothetical protein OF83DRAFT_1178401 [Amylostereum chailletii]
MFYWLIKKHCQLCITLENIPLSEIEQEALLDKLQCLGCSIYSDRLKATLCNDCISYFQTVNVLPSSLLKIEGMHDLILREEGPTSNYPKSRITSAVIQCATVFQESASDVHLGQSQKHAPNSSLQKANLARLKKSQASGSTSTPAAVHKQERMNKRDSVKGKLAQVTLVADVMSTASKLSRKKPFVIPNLKITQSYSSVGSMCDAVRDMISRDPMLYQAMWSTWSRHAERDISG